MPYNWHQCVDCGRERWVRFTKDGKPQNTRCYWCANVRKGWRGGRVNADGYIYVLITSDNFFFPMAVKKISDKAGYVLEHRLVIAQSIGRNLHSWEIVHHKNHIRDDNRIDNLQLFSDNRHKQITLLENKIKRLENKLEALEKKYKLLIWLHREEKEVGANVENPLVV